MIGLLKELEDIMMLRPVNADHHEAQNVGEIRWPQIEKLAQQIAGTLVWNLNVQNEQRDRDGEHAIAESLDPIRFAFGAARLRRAKTLPQWRAALQQD